MTERHRRTPLSGRAANWNLALIWVVIVIGLLTAIGCVGFTLDQAMTSYAVCGPRDDGCNGGDAGWYSSMGLTLFGGFAAIIVSGAIGIRRHTRLTGVWYPVAGLGALILLTTISYVLIKGLTRT